MAEFSQSEYLRVYKMNPATGQREIVRMKQSTMTPELRAKALASTLNQSPQTAATTGAGANPVGAVPNYSNVPGVSSGALAPVSVPNTAPINYTGLSSYIMGNAGLNVQSANTREDLALQQQQAAWQLNAGKQAAQQQLDNAKIQLARGQGDAAYALQQAETQKQQGLQQTEKSVVAATRGLTREMSGANLLFSGERELGTQGIEDSRQNALFQLEQSYGAPFRKQVEDQLWQLQNADRMNTQQVQNQLAQIDQQYGSGYAEQVRVQMAQIARNEALQRQQIEAAAKQEYSQIYQPAPIQTQAAPAPAPAPAAAAPAGDGKWHPAGNTAIGSPVPNIPGATFAGRKIQPNGSYAPLIKYSNGTTVIHPSWK